MRRSDGATMKTYCVQYLKHAGALEPVSLDQTDLVEQNITSNVPEVLNASSLAAVGRGSEEATSA